MCRVVLHSGHERVFRSADRFDKVNKFTNLVYFCSLFLYVHASLSSHLHHTFSFQPRSLSLLFSFPSSKFSLLLLPLIPHHSSSFPFLAHTFLSHRPLVISFHLISSLIFRDMTDLCSFIHPSCLFPPTLAFPSLCHVPFTISCIPPHDLSA